MDLADRLLRCMGLPPEATFDERRAWSDAHPWRAATSWTLLFYWPVAAACVGLLVVSPEHRLLAVLGVTVMPLGTTLLFRVLASRLDR